MGQAVALGRWVLALADAWLVPLGFTVASPREDARRGGRVTLRHPDAERLSRVLIENGVLIDFRRPDGIRVGLSPLTTGFTEVRAAMDRDPRSPPDPKVMNDSFMTSDSSHVLSSHVPYLA